MAALLQVARNSQAETGKVERASLIQDYFNPALPDDWRERLGVFGQLDQDASDYQLEFTLRSTGRTTVAHAHSLKHQSQFSPVAKALELFKAQSLEGAVYFFTGCGVSTNNLLRLWFRVAVVGYSLLVLIRFPPTLRY